MGQGFRPAPPPSPPLAALALGRGSASGSNPRPHCLFLSRCVGEIGGAGLRALPPASVSMQRTPLSPAVAQTRRLITYRRMHTLKAHKLLYRHGDRETIGGVSDNAAVGWVLIEWPMLNTRGALHMVGNSRFHSAYV